LSSRGSIVFADGHLHVNPVRGLGASEVARRFARAGGWFAAVVSLPPWHYGIDPVEEGLKAYDKLLEHHLLECKRFREAGVKTACIAGFHPAEVDRLISMGMPPEKVLDLGTNVVRMLYKACREGKLDGIGEVGRQHYKTAPERLAVALVVALEAVELAIEAGCVVHLHLESYGALTADTTDYLIRKVLHGTVALKRVVFHHASVKLAARAVELGYSATVPGFAKALEQAFKAIGPRFVPESDYIDDTKRGCTVLCPWELVQNELHLLEQGVVGEDELLKVNVDEVVRVYGVEPP
jgi:TatD-related deoxyribonuclease